MTAPKMHVERTRGLLKTYPNQLGLVGMSGFTAWENAYLLKEGSLKKCNISLSD